MSRRRSVAPAKARSASERGPRFRRRDKPGTDKRDSATAAEKPASLRSMIGTCIQQHRLQARLTQADLAAKTDLSLKYVGEIERGEANIRIDTLDRLVRGVGWDVAKSLGQGPQTLNDGIRRLLRSQLEDVGQYIVEVMRWLDALKPDQPALNVADADIPAPAHLASRPPSTPRRKR
jgi:transcriptional regulator with XRE-family HTH domain